LHNLTSYLIIVYFELKLFVALKPRFILFFLLFVHLLTKDQ
jgi:hypothetical protein